MDKKYIFPGGYIPSIRELAYNMAENDLHLIDLEVYAYITVKP